MSTRLSLSLLALTLSMGATAITTTLPAQADGYVAIEQVAGTLAGRTGSFILQHTGVMNRGAQALVINVIPDSGTGELAGISGTMQIEIVGKAHSYVLEYTLPAVP